MKDYSLHLYIIFYLWFIKKILFSEFCVQKGLKLLPCIQIEAVINEDKSTLVNITGSWRQFVQRIHLGGEFIMVGLFSNLQNYYNRSFYIGTFSIKNGSCVDNMFESRLRSRILYIFKPFHSCFSRRLVIWLSGLETHHGTKIPKTGFIWVLCRIFEPNGVYYKT